MAIFDQSRVLWLRCRSAKNFAWSAQKFVMTTMCWQSDTAVSSSSTKTHVESLFITLPTTLIYSTPLRHSMLHTARVTAHPLITINVYKTRNVVNNNYYYNYFTTLCLGLPGWVSTRRIDRYRFCCSRDDGVAVASAEPYASQLHFAPEDNHANTLSLRFLQAECSSWHPTNSVKALKAKKH